MVNYGAGVPFGCAVTFTSDAEDVYPGLCTFEGLLSSDEYVNSIVLLARFPAFLRVPCRASIILIGVLELERARGKLGSRRSA